MRWQRRQQAAKRLKRPNRQQKSKTTVFKSDAKVRSSSTAGTEEIEVEELFEGVASILKQGIGMAVDKSSTMVPGVQSMADTAASFAKEKIAAVGGFVSTAVGCKDSGSQEKK